MKIPTQYQLIVAIGQNFKQILMVLLGDRIDASGAPWWPSSTEIIFKLFQLKDLHKLWTLHSGTVVPLAMISYFDMENTT